MITKSKLALIIVLGLLSPAAMAKGAIIPCTKSYTPATPGYDFKADIGHWGQKHIRYDLSPKDRVGKIYITPLPIFDTNKPAEDNALYRLVNKMHRPFRAKHYVIRNLVLFKKGGPITNEAIEESERLLRRQKYASEASILPVSKCGHKVCREHIICPVL